MLARMLQRRKSRKGRRGRASKFGSPRDPAGVRRVHMLPVAVLIAAVAVVAFCYTGWHQVWPLLRDRPEYQATLADLWITQPPPWVQHDMLREVQEQAALPHTFSLLDGDLAARLADAFGKHPWVERVEQVRIRRGGAIAVQLRYRRPVAMVQTPGHLLPVDAHGTLLPAEDFTADEASQFPLIRGVQSSPLCPVGGTWDDPLVVGGAKIAEVLLPHWMKLDLQAVEGVFWSAAPTPAEEGALEETPLDSLAEERKESAAEASNGTFYLLSRGGTRVVWGRPPDSDNPGEIPASDKIARLQKYVADYGSLDSPNGPYELDIRHWKDLSRRPRTVSSAELR
jgi:hypothetical protein